jgi:hypothetical protein
MVRPTCLALKTVIAQPLTCRGHSVVVTQCGRIVIFGRPYDFKTLMRLNHINSAAPGLARMASHVSAALGGATTEIFAAPQKLLTEHVCPGESIVDAACSAGLTVMCTGEVELLQRPCDCSQVLRRQGYRVIYGVQSVGTVRGGNERYTRIRSYCDLGKLLHVIFVTSPYACKALQGVEVLQVGAGLQHVVCCSRDGQGISFRT